MKTILKLSFTTLFFLGSFSVISKNPNIFYSNGPFEAAFVGKMETETAADINGNLFNSHVHDKLVATKTKIDLSMTTKSDVSRSKITMRNKIVWGNHKVISTDLTWLANLNADPAAHSHKIGQNMVWIREAWVETDMTKVCKLEDVPKQTFTIGSFSFQLGRGIALGDAYGVTPASMGFFQDSTVDQYAWGAKLSGEIIRKFMNYDAYISILENKSTNLTETNFPSQAKAFGTNDVSKVRGAGKISFVNAGRLVVTPLNEDNSFLSLEPYVMHYYDPLQKVEYQDDAKSTLTTAGLAVEFSSNRFELGFDMANNFGHQYVKGWDRNSVKVVNSGGYAAYVYTDVYTVNPAVTTPTAADTVLFDPANTAQISAINGVNPGAVSNGALINGTTLYNSLTRYRMPYRTNFRGYMCVLDASFWVIPSNLVANVTAGLSSGDQNPNANLLDPNDSSVDGNYNGFISFQELYSGKRVQSFFSMTSALTKPLNISNTDGSFATVANHFSNLIFWGCGVKYSPANAVKKWNINPNFLMYWQDVASNTFDTSTGLSTNTLASKYLGSEVNIFFMTTLSENMYVSGGGALFTPGVYYFDIKGKPTSSAQRSLLNAAIKAGKSTKELPLISNNSSYSVSMAMGYMF